jgi:hypothetical protein
MLELLVIQAHGRADRRPKLLSAIVHEPSVEVQAAELLGSNSDTQKLLLQGPLLLGKVLIGRYQLIIQILVHSICSARIFEGGRSEDFFGEGKSVQVHSRTYGMSVSGKVHPS